MAKQIIDKLEDIKMQFDIAAKANLRLLRESDAFGRHCGRSIDLRDDDFKNRLRQTRETYMSLIGKRS